MTPFAQAILGAVMLIIGAVKTWTHVMSAGTVLSLQTCTGKTVMLSLGSGSFLEQAHCWGCYLALAGLIVLIAAGVNVFKQRRTVAYALD